MSKYKVGIIGNGFVGESQAFAFSPTSEVRVFDIDPLKATNTLEEVYECDFIFVCVPTPMYKDGTQDLSYVEKVFEDKMDCIINCADIGNAQVNISIRAFRNKIPCINIGSKITEAKVTDHWDIITKDNKITLEHMSKKFKQTYLTWGFTEGNAILDANPSLLETISIDDAVEEVVNELGTTQ